MPQKIVAGNWKMNLTYQEGEKLVADILAGTWPNDVKLVFCVPSPYLSMVQQQVMTDVRDTFSAAQDCHQKEKGAFTGDISTKMLNSLSVGYTVLGHSERRAYHQETDALLSEKLAQAMGAGLNVIFCCGENLETRESGDYIAFVKAQLEKTVMQLEVEQMAQLTIAYEPIWAIGTGKTASPDQAQEVHAAIRMLVKEKYGNQIATDLSILYGGSVKPTNAEAIFAQMDVDGALVGGASLKAADFLSIANAF